MDFVGEPGQFAIRGAIVDIFSYSYNDPFRISFFGDEIDSINVFDCNTQLSKDKVDEADIYPDIALAEGEESVMRITDMLPAETLVWMDSSDMYRNKEFFTGLERFRRVFLELPLSRQNEDAVKFQIVPQPVFNKNFELLTEDIRKRLEEGYRVRIYGEKKSQLERLQSILSQNGGVMPEFVAGKNIHNGFIDNENKVCCYSDHEIFDRFHRVSIRRTVEKSEQLTINDLTSFAIGDYIVHIDYGVGIFGGLVRMRDDKGRMRDISALPEGKETLKAKENIVGVQAQLWTETVRSFDHVTYYVFPKVCGMFERAWNASPVWEGTLQADDPAFMSALDRYYSTVVSNEVPYFEEMQINYRSR